MRFSPGLDLVPHAITKFEAEFVRMISGVSWTYPVLDFAHGTTCENHLDFNDYYDASQTQNAKGRRVSQGAVPAIAAVLFWASIRTGNTRARHVYFLLALLLVAALPVAKRLNRRSFKNAYERAAAKSSANELTVEISEDGIQGSDCTNREEWSHFY